MRPSGFMTLPNQKRRMPRRYDEEDLWASSAPVDGAPQLIVLLCESSNRSADLDLTFEGMGSLID